jgi:hypothetical protein
MIFIIISWPAKNAFVWVLFNPFVTSTLFHTTKVGVFS